MLPSPRGPRATKLRRDAGAAEPARLESVWGATPRGFKSHSLRWPAARGGEPRPPSAPELSVEAGSGRAGSGGADVDVRAARPLLRADAEAEHLGAALLGIGGGRRRRRRCRVGVLRLAR